MTAAGLPVADPVEAVPLPSILRHNAAMTLRSVVCLAITGVALLYAGVLPAFAVDGVTIAKTTVTAARADDGLMSATVDVVNNGDEVTLVPPAGVDGNLRCTVSVDPRTVLARQGASLKLTFAPECFPTTVKNASQIRFDLDGDGAMAPVTIKAPADSPSPWIALAVGAASGAASALAFFFWSRNIHGQIRQKRVPASGEVGYDEYVEKRAGAYEKVKEIVNARWDQIWPAGPRPEWDNLPARSYDLGDPVNGLEAKWSLKDSWMANLTAVISAVVAVATSDQLVTAVSGDKPKGPLGVIAIAGLIGVALVATSTTLVKLIGERASEVTVRGLLVSNTLLLGAAVFEIVAVTIAGGYALGAWGDLGKSVGLIGLGLLLAFLAWRYLDEKLEQTLEEGVPASGVPAIPLDEFEKWTVPADDPADPETRNAAAEKRQLLEQRIRTALGQWLSSAAQADTQVGSPWEDTGMSVGEDKWGPTAKPDPEKENSPGLL